MAAPENDNLDGAIPFGVNTAAGPRVSAVTTEATREFGEQRYTFFQAPQDGVAYEGTIAGVGPSFSFNTVWYSYTPAISGPARITTEGSDFDTSLAVWRLTDPMTPRGTINLTSIVENGNDLAGARPDDSTVQFNGVANTQYLIQAGTQDTTGGGNLVVTVDGPIAVCFTTGTRIRTVRGDVAVEDLAIGDVAITRDGRRKPIRWIGCRDTRCDRHPAPAKVWPVRVAAGTFGDGLPYADLWLSPGHALCLDNSLVPVRGLIDGKRIKQVEQDTVTYWHVELDSHDVLLANGLPAESYLDTGNRRGFDNAEAMTVARTLHFDEAPAAGYDGSGYCLPMIESGLRLSGIRARYELGGAGQATDWDETSLPHLLVDGRELRPQRTDDRTLCFLLPADSAEVCLVSRAFPGAGADRRRLGVILNALAVSDGAGWRRIALDDVGLCAGFHEIEQDETAKWRWTDGSAHLSPSLWAGLSGVMLLRVEGVFTELGPAVAAEVGERVNA